MSKFNAGTVVRWVGNFETQSFTKGNHYLVGGKYHSGPYAINGRTGVIQDDTGNENGHEDQYFELVPDGPVRTKVVKEIVGGDYGKVHVSTYDDTRARIGIDSIMNSKELTDAITTLTAIRDALQEHDK